MNSYIKYIVEAFDFSSVNKNNKSVNAYDMLLLQIFEKIKNHEELAQEDNNILKQCIGVYKVADREELIEISNYYISQFGNECSLNWIDTGEVTDMSRLFYDSNFTGDISKWDVGKVTNMSSMFEGSKFNGDIADWNVSNVRDMHNMFRGSTFSFNKKMNPFNGNIGKWNVCNVIDMHEMFYYSKFNSDISQWNVWNVANMEYMFAESKFNKNISNWNINKNCKKFAIFAACPIKGEYRPNL